jgi:hypothetical protein
MCLGVATMMLMIKNFQYLTPCKSGIEVLLGENPLRCTTQDEKGLASPYYNPFFTLYFDPIKNNESKVVKFFKRTIF